MFMTAYKDWGEGQCFVSFLAPLLSTAQLSGDEWEISYIDEKSSTGIKYNWNMLHTFVRKYFYSYLDIKQLHSR